MDGFGTPTATGPDRVLRSLVTLVLERGGMTIAGAWWPWSDSLVRELAAVDVAISPSLRAGIARFSLRLGDP